MVVVIWHARPTFELPPFYLHLWNSSLYYLLLSIFTLLQCPAAPPPPRLMSKSSQYIRTLSVFAHIYSLKIRTNLIWQFMKCLHNLLIHYTLEIWIKFWDLFFFYLILFRNSSIVFLWIKVINCQLHFILIPFKCSNV